MHVFSVGEEIRRGDDAVGGGVALQLRRQLLDVAHVVEHDKVQQKREQRKRQRHVEPPDSKNQQNVKKLQIGQNKNSY